MSIQFDDATATDFAGAARSAASLFRGQSGSRSSAGDAARTDFSGGYLPVLNDLCTTETEDRSRLARRFEELADDVDLAVRRASEERERIAEAQRAEATNRQLAAMSSSGIDFAALFPIRESVPVQPPPIGAAFQARIRSRASRGRQSGTTSANPDRLRASADTSSALNSAVVEEHSRLVSALGRYQGACSWAPVEDMTAFHAVTVYNDENYLDEAWLRRIADAFDRAGRGSLSTILLDLVTTRESPVPLKDLAKYIQALSTDDQLTLAVLDPDWLGVEAVEAWWSGLGVAERDALIAGAPALIGNLNGIPITDRVAANQVRAAVLAKVPGITKQEKDYWKAIANGTRNAVLMMPEFEAVIEMIGTISSDTTHSITYVPGTTATIDGFYSESHQQVAKRMVDKSGGSAVSFAYVNGPWIDWVGPRANTNGVFLDQLSRDLKKFQTEVVDRDPVLGQAQVTLIGHSAAATVVTQAAAHGGRVHTVVSLAGSFIASPRAMDPRIKYHHFQYDNDPTSYITPVTDFLIPGPGLQTPGNLLEGDEGVGFTQHIYDSDGMKGMDAHTTISLNNKRNQDLLEDLAKAIGVSSEAE